MSSTFQTVNINAHLDRVQIVAIPKTSDRRVTTPLGFFTQADRCVKPQTNTKTYGRCRTMVSLESAAKVYLQYERKQGWLNPWKITFVPEDTAGLTLEDFLPFTSMCREYHLITVELAFDFDPAEGALNGAFVRQHGRFGKARIQNERGGPGQLRYGTRHSGKLVRCYQKNAVSAYRVELQLNSSLLARNAVSQVEHLPGLKFVYPSHIRFVRLTRQGLSRALQKKFGERRGAAIYRTAMKRSATLQDVCAYLRGKGIYNVHRFLLPMTINHRLRKSLIEWSETFLPAGGLTNYEF